MQKEIIITIVIVVLIIIMDVWTQSYTNKSVESMKDLLNELQSSIIKGKASNDIQSAVLNI